MKKFLKYLGLVVVGTLVGCKVQDMYNNRKEIKNKVQRTKDVWTQE